MAEPVVHGADRARRSSPRGQRGRYPRTSRTSMLNRTLMNYVSSFMFSFIRVFGVMLSQRNLLRSQLPVYGFSSVQLVQVIDIDIYSITFPRYHIAKTQISVQNVNPALALCADVNNP